MGDAAQPVHRQVIGSIRNQDSTIVMARIPAEKENGSNWWGWLLALLILAGGVWLVTALIGGEEEPVADVPEVVPAPVEPPAGATVMDLATITTASTVADFFGRELQINNLYVTEVASDKAFFVCSTETGTPGGPITTNAGGDTPCTTEEVLVVLDENPGAGPTPPPGSAVEGAVNVNPGQMLTIQNGRIGEFNRTQADQWGIGGDALALAEEDEFYIEANDVNITAEQGTA